MDEVQLDIENNWRYLPKPQAEENNADRGFNNSRCPLKSEFNNYFLTNMEHYDREEVKYSKFK